MTHPPSPPSMKECQPTGGPMQGLLQEVIDALTRTDGCKAWRIELYNMHYNTLPPHTGQLQHQHSDGRDGVSSVI